MYIELYTDSSRWGMGAWCEGEWWSVGWPEQARRETAPSMTWLELIPIVVACVIWGESWSGRRVRVYYDNMGVVGVWGERVVWQCCYHGTGATFAVLGRQERFQPGRGIRCH